MNRFLLALSALALLVSSQAQAFHPGNTYHYRVHGHGVGAPPVGLGTPSFQSAPQANVQFVPQANFQLVPALSFGFNQFQPLVSGNFMLNNPAPSPSEALLPTNILDILRRVCAVVNTGNGNPGATVDLAPLNAKVAELSTKLAELRLKTDETLALVKGIHEKILTPAPAPAATPLVPKVMPKTESLPAPRSSLETPCEFKLLREQAERLAAGSVKTEVVLKASK